MIKTDLMEVSNGIVRVWVLVSDSAKRDYYAKKTKIPAVLSGCKVRYFYRFIGRIRKKSTSFIELEKGNRNHEPRQTFSAGIVTC
jgi:hypothetical protein